MFGRSVIVPLLLAVLAGSAWSAERAPDVVEGATTVSPVEAKALHNRGVKFVDVRQAKYWEAGRIPGAISLDFIMDFSKERLLAHVAPDDEVVFYCEGPG